MTLVMIKEQIIYPDNIPYGLSLLIPKKPEHLRLVFP